MAVKVPVEFEAQFSKALEGLGDFAKQTDKRLADLQKKFNVFGSTVSFNAFLEIGKKVINVLGDMANAFGATIEEAAEAQQVMNEMNQALKASGDFSEQNVQAFRDLADQLSKTTKFDDDLIISQVKLAKQFNTTNKEAAELITSATELSAATGMDLPSSVRALGQTLDGTAGKIGEMIPSIKTLTAEQLRSGEAIKVVAERFKGFASSELLTFNGALGETKKSFKDLLEQIGKSIVENDSAIAVLQAITEGTRQFTDFLAQNQDEIKQFVSQGIKFMVDAFGVLIQVTDIVVRQFGIMISQIEALASGFTGLWQIMQTRVSVGFNTIAEAAKKYNSDMTKVAQRSQMFDKATQFAADLSVKLEKMADSSTKVAKKTKDVVSGFDELGTRVKRFDPEILQKIKSLEESLKDIGVNSIKTLENKYDREFQLIKDAEKYRVIESSKAEELIKKLRMRTNQEIYKDLEGKVQAAFQNPASIFNQNPEAGGSLGISPKAQTGVAAGLGFVNNVLGGAEGARKFLGGIAPAIGTAFLGPLGQVIGPIVEQLSKGPDFVKTMVRDFLRALPELLSNVVRSMPAFISEFIKQIPYMIDAFIDQIPLIIEAFIMAIPDIITAWLEAMPRLIEAIITKLPGAIIGGIGKAFEKLFNSIGDGFIGKMLSGAGQFVGKLIEGAGRFIAKLIEELTGIGSERGLFGTGLFNFSGGGFGFGGNKGLLGGGIVSGILRQDSESQREQARTFSSSNTQTRFGPRTLEIPIRVGASEFARTVVDVQRLGYRLEPI